MAFLEYIFTIADKFSSLTLRSHSLTNDLTSDSWMCSLENEDFRINKTNIIKNYFKGKTGATNQIIKNLTV